MTWWFINDAIPIFLLQHAAPENVIYIWGSRILMFLLLAGIMYLVNRAWTGPHRKVSE
jgi:hypothetical protein